MKSSIKVALFAIALSFIPCMQGCKPTMALFDQYAYTQAISAKVDALVLMNMSTDPYSSHLQDIANLNNELQKIYEYDKNRPRNTITASQWEILISPDRHLLGGFLVKWKKDSKEDTTYISEKKKEIGLAFDQIIQLEVAKNKK